MSAQKLHQEKSKESIEVCVNSPLYLTASKQQKRADEKTKNVK